MVILGGMMVVFNSIMILEMIGLYRLNEKRGLRNTALFTMFLNSIVGICYYLGYLV